MKLKTNLSYITLSILFNSVITPTTCREMFIESVLIFAHILQPCVLFLSNSQIDMHLPICFKNFKNVRILLNCTRIEVEKPKYLCCQLKLYSV